jgi:hypothetical protein
MKVYEVNANDGESPIAYATKTEALKEACVAAKEYCPAGEVVEVNEVTLCKLDKATIVRIINGGGRYVEASRVVASFPSQRKEPS